MAVAHPPSPSPDVTHQPMSISSPRQTPYTGSFVARGFHSDNGSELGVHQQACRHSPGQTTRPEVRQVPRPEEPTTMHWSNPKMDQCSASKGQCLYSTSPLALPKLPSTLLTSLVVRQSDNLGYWSLFTCRSRKAGLIRHPNLSHGQTTSGLSF